MKALHGFDATEKLDMYKEHPKVFHTLGYHPVSGAVFFLKRPPDTKLFLSYNNKLSVSSLDIYDICLGHINGLSTGFLFHSPLILKSDYFYLVFHRKTVNAQRDIVQATIEKRLVTADLVMHSNQSVHFIVTRGLATAITNFCSTP